MKIKLSKSQWQLIGKMDKKNKLNKLDKKSQIDSTFDQNTMEIANKRKKLLNDINNMMKNLELNNVEIIRNFISDKWFGLT